jgi:hypothetical protein
MVFKDVEQLKEFLTEDRGRADLNPIRFINVDSLQMWIEVKKYLVSLSNKSLLLSDFCEMDDTTPNLKRLRSVLRKADQTLCVFPLSEYLRVNPESAVSIITDLQSMEYQNNDTHRMHIYFLMYRISSVLQAIPNTDPRRENSFLYLKTGEEQDYQLTIIQNSLNVHVGGNEIIGFKRYLQYWEQNPDKPLVLHTQNAIHFERNHFFDNVKVIVTPFDLCKDQIHDFPAVLREEMGTRECWYSFAEKATGAGSFEEACGLCLTTNRYSLDLFGIWSILTPFKKWVLWLWTKVRNKKGYLFECAVRCKSVDSFAVELYTGIMQYVETNDYIQKYKERKTALKNMQLTPSEAFWKMLQTVDPIKAIACLTNLTDVERKKIFKIIKEVSYNDRVPYIVVLKTVYPELAYYLNNDVSVNSAGLTQFHFDYFEEYKWLKATDNITRAFVDKVHAIAQQRGESVYLLQPRNQLVTEVYNDHTMILFVDGMGIEYADYLAFVFSDIDQEKYRFFIKAGYCNLPTITEVNKDFMNGRQTVEPPMRELDEHKHAYCIYPENIIRELEILKAVKDRALSALSGTVSRIIIATDHGTSRMAVRVRNSEFDNVLPKPEGTPVYKYGRFCDKNPHRVEYETAISYGDKLIFADYSRFVQPGAPIDEIHGGASLEEWIVPVAVVESTQGAMGAEKVTIELLTEEVKPQVGTGLVTVRFKMSGKDHPKASVKIKGKTIPCVLKDKEYSFDYRVYGKEDTITAQVIDGTILGKLTVSIVQGIKKSRNFDI